MNCRDESLKTVSKKSLTGQERCLTPDCWGYLTSIIKKHQSGKVYNTKKLNSAPKKVNVDISDKQASSITKTKSNKILPFKMPLNNVQKADIRHLVKEPKVIMKIEEKEDSAKNRKKLKKKSIQRIRNIQKILIEPIPMIRNKYKEAEEKFNTKD